jgi:hypothetical protein
MTRACSLCDVCQSGDVYLGSAQSALPVSLSQGDGTQSQWTVRMVRDDENAEYISDLIASYASGMHATGAGVIACMLHATCACVQAITWC